MDSQLTGQIISEGKMSTRATIKFSDGDEQYYVYRDCDGFPENILPDLRRSIDVQEACRYGSAECGMLVTHFLGLTYVVNVRVPDYEITKCFHSDESFRYYVTWDNKEKKWKINR